MVNIGDKVMITKLSGAVLESPQIATVEDVGGTWFEIEDGINGDDIVYMDEDMDVWHKIDSPDSLVNIERVKVGSEIIVTRVNRVKLMSPRKVTVVDVSLPIIKVHPEINGETLLYAGGHSMDSWHIEEEDADEVRSIPEVGDKIVVTKLNGTELYEPAVVSTPDTDGLVRIRLTDLFESKYLQVSGDYADEWVSVKDLEKTESTPKVGQLVKVGCDGLSEYGEVVETDVTEAGEYEFKIKTGTSSTTYKLNQVDSIETYKGDEDKIMPNYIELASGGMTFSEFAGEDITEESLNFRPYDDKVNHPSHYNKYSREVIESIKGLCTPDEFRGYLKGNIIKYSARYSDKDGVQDIDKLAKYTQFLKEFELEQAKLSEEE